MTAQDSTARATIINSTEFKEGKTVAYEKLMMFSFRNSFHNPSNLEKLHLNMPANYSTASRALFTGLGPDLKSYDFYPACEKFKFPVLILHGKYDALSLVISEKIQSHIPGSKLVLFEESGHFLFIEEPQKFERTIREFLR